MGARGPVGLPPSIHALRGTVPGADRGGEKAKPLKVRPGAPEPPGWLQGEGLAEWGRVVPPLDELGLLSSVDRAILSSYCVSWSVLCRAVAELENADALTTEGSRGPVRTPEFRTWRDAVAVLAMLAAKIMVTPTDRLRMRLPAVTDSDPGRILD